jgi:hypothetical protein
MYENGYIFSVYDFHFHRLPGGCFRRQTSFAALCDWLWRMGVVHLALLRAYEEKSGKADARTAIPGLYAPAAAQAAALSLTSILQSVNNFNIIFAFTNGKQPAYQL